MYQYCRRMHLKREERIQNVIFPKKRIRNKCEKRKTSHWLPGVSLQFENSTPISLLLTHSLCTIFWFWFRNIICSRNECSKSFLCKSYLRKNRSRASIWQVSCRKQMHLGRIFLELKNSIKKIVLFEIFVRFFQRKFREVTAEVLSSLCCKWYSKLEIPLDENICLETIQGIPKNQKIKYK